MIRPRQPRPGALAALTPLSCATFLTGIQSTRGNSRLRPDSLSIESSSIALSPTRHREADLMTYLRCPCGHEFSGDEYPKPCGSVAINNPDLDMLSCAVDEMRMDSAQASPSTSDPPPPIPAKSSPLLCLRNLDLAEYLNEYLRAKARVFLECPSCGGLLLQEAIGGNQFNYYVSREDG